MIGICEICKYAKEEKLHQIVFPNGTYQCCGWCADRGRQYLHNSREDHSINIAWGGGKVHFGEMKMLMQLVMNEGIKSIIEYGTGLSTELLSFVCDDLWTLDEFEKHSLYYSRLKTLHKRVVFIRYDSSHPDRTKRPELEDCGRTFDMAFVDGGQCREREVRHAMKHATRIIYLHDPGLGEQDFFPTVEWEMAKDQKLFRRKSHEDHRATP